jgi:ribosomal protein L9
MITTVKIDSKTKENLDTFRSYKNESYAEVITKLITIARNVGNKPKISQEIIKEIEAARKRIAQGEYYTEDEVLKRFGLNNVHNKVRQKSNSRPRKASE